MKKVVYLLLVVVLLSFMMGCTSRLVESEEPALEPIKVASLKGPTSIGLVKLMDDNKNGLSANDYDFLITATADEIIAKISKGDLDVAAIPANLASVLYNKTEGKIKVAAINTLGVLYIVENADSLETIQDLKGKTIYTTGKGTTPEHVLNYILSSNGIDVDKDVTIEYKSEATEVATILASEENVIALLPQPFIAASQTKNDKIRQVFSMEEEWQKLNKNSSQVTGVVIVNNDFLEKNPSRFEEFLKEYEASVEFVNNNVEKSAELVGGLDIIPAPVARKAIPLCNVVFISGDEMKDKLSSYLTVLYNSDPQSIGGQLPDEDFYIK